MTPRSLLLAPAACALLALAEVNRRLALIQPVIDVFAAESRYALSGSLVGKRLNKQLMVGDERPPVDLVRTVDVDNLQPIMDARVILSVQGDVLEAAMPVELRAPDDLWFALTHHARAAAPRIKEEVSFDS